MAVAWVLASMLAARRGRLVLAGSLIGLGILTKPQHIVAAPVALWIAARVDGIPTRRLINGIAAGALAIAAPSALFRLWPWDLAARVLRSSAVYPYASVNALNFWNGLGGNWRSDAA
ncbi:MAG: hypothetical protein FJX78_08355 [Armatimonadetes bacterium]|nr:hypothetical protein [Armatimonadota bacterium]